MKRIQQGFTLIELVVVITILGILAATALPRFVGLQSDARAAKLNAARGAIQSATGMIYGAAQARTGIAQGACPIGGAVTTISTTGLGQVCTASGLVNVVNWNPVAQLPGGAVGTPGGIVDAAGLSAVFPATAATLLADGYVTVGGGAGINSTITIRVSGGSNPTNCSFTYKPSNATSTAGTAATISAAVTTGC